MAVVLLKVLIALGSGLLGAWALRTRVVELPEKAFVRWALGLQAIPALALFVALYVVGHQEPTSDVPSYYLPAAHAVLAGRVPVRDFTLSYAPLFPYVAAALVSLWDSGKVFALFDILLNAAALLLWHTVANACHGRATARQSTLLYASCGHVLVQALLGTNQIWIGVALAASATLLLRNRDLGAGVAQAVAAGATKLLAHLFWPVLWIFAPRRSAWLLGALVPVLGLYGGFVALGAGQGLLHPLRYEDGKMSSGNLPYLLDLALGGSGAAERFILDGLTLVAVATAFGWLFSSTRTVPPESRPRLLPAGLALAGLVLMCFSKKSFTGYVVFVMYPLVLMLVAGQPNARARIGFLLAFNVLLVAEPSLWFHLDGFNRTLRTWFAGGGGLAAMGFVCVDLTLLACYVYLGWLSVRWVQSTVAGAMADKNASQSATACSLV
jgi:hypothetical protein